MLGDKFYLMLQCSVTCGRGQQQREIMCVDGLGSSVAYDRCTATKPRNTKRCAAGKCPTWRKGRWGKVRTDRCTGGRRVVLMTFVNNNRNMMMVMMITRMITTAMTMILRLLLLLVQL